VRWRPRTLKTGAGVTSDSDRDRECVSTHVRSWEIGILTYRIDNTIHIRAVTALLATIAILSYVPATAKAQAPSSRASYSYHSPSCPYHSAPAGNRAAYYYAPSTNQTAPATNRSSYYYPARTTTYAARPATATVAAATTAAARPASAPAVAANTTRAAAPATTAAAPTGDPYGFTAWLNATRARYGLAPVGYDPNLASWAATNNAQQNARGMGHHVMGPSRRQNCAMGNGASIGSMWMNSPAHRANMLAPDIRYIGIAGSGAYWTLNAY
jgi:uncharacterized protein YkwD